ncbi:keratin-associated protein 5-8-like [Penaeus japonicus]|uniref:keratin-associated protein 5-8-like n=1 Tax=Penaeus japonicus TaxID=27405 RepID=UPI001C710987|nr:keratin-associated protein 5-8-like [Penaeus japonicus]
MASNLHQMAAMRTLLLWTLSWLASSSAQGICKPVAFNKTPSISSFSQVQAMEDELSSCCWSYPSDRCKKSDGFCIPSWLGKFCPQTKDFLCGRCGCTCCITKPPPPSCTGTCGSLTRKGNCRPTCSALEEGIPGNCPTGNCRCCAKKPPPTCGGSCGSPVRRGTCRSTCRFFEETITGSCSTINCRCCAMTPPRSCSGYCLSRGERCIHESECHLKKNDIDGFSIGATCGSAGCLCCPDFAIL